MTYTAGSISQYRHLGCYSRLNSSHNPPPLGAVALMRVRLCVWWEGQGGWIVVGTYHNYTKSKLICFTALHKAIFHKMWNMMMMMNTNGHPVSQDVIPCWEFLQRQLIKNGTLLPFMHSYLSSLILSYHQRLSLVLYPSPHLIYCLCSYIFHWRLTLATVIKFNSARAHYAISFSTLHPLYFNVQMNLFTS